MRDEDNFVFGQGFLRWQDWCIVAFLFLAIAVMIIPSFEVSLGLDFTAVNEPYYHDDDTGQIISQFDYNSDLIVKNSSVIFKVYEWCRDAFRAVQNYTKQDGILSQIVDHIIHPAKSIGNFINEFLNVIHQIFGTRAPGYAGGN